MLLKAWVPLDCLCTGHNQLNANTYRMGLADNKNVKTVCAETSNLSVTSSIPLYCSGPSAITNKDLIEYLRNSSLLDLTT